LYTANGVPIAGVYTDSLGRKHSRKTIKGSKHLLRTPPGIAFDVSALKQADRLGVIYHVVHDQETGKTYCAEHHLFARHGFPVARGFNAQTGLGMQHWKEGDQPPASLFDLLPPQGGSARAAHETQPRWGEELHAAARRILEGRP